MFALLPGALPGFEKGGGGSFFERVRKLQTTLTRIFIVLESESHGLSDFGRFILKIETEIRPKSEIQTLFQPKNR